MLVAVVGSSIVLNFKREGISGLENKRQYEYKKYRELFYAAWFSHLLIQM
jgi:hypothetical protein